MCVCLCVYIYCPFSLLPCFLMFIGILPETRFPSRCRQNALGDQHRVFGTLQSIASCVQDKTKQNETKKANKKKSWGINRVLCERERARESECAFLFVCVSVCASVCVCICMCVCARASENLYLNKCTVHTCTCPLPVFFYRAHKYMCNSANMGTQWEHKTTHLTQLFRVFVFSTLEAGGRAV